MSKHLLLAWFGFAFSTAPVFAGEVYVIDNAAGKKPIVIQKDPFALKNVPDMGGKERPNQGFNYGTALELAGTGVQVMRGHVDAGGTIATHEGTQQYILYVIAGTGKLALVDKDGATTVGEVKYKPDDVIVFQPNTLHNWKNESGAAFEFLGVVPATPRNN
jgi:quercetin dioxygenase-like cupin family protein